MVALNSEESLLEHELDLTNHHEYISTGINNIKKLYGTTRSEARKLVELAYIEKLEKIPKRLQYLQSSLSSINFHLISLSKTSIKSKFSFTLLKSCGPGGSLYLSISGFGENFSVSSKNQIIEMQSSTLPDLTISVFNDKDCQIFTYRISLLDQLAKIPVEQLSAMSQFSLFDNKKTNNVDICMLISIQLCPNQLYSVLRVQAREIQGKIEKLRMEAQGINLKKEFKASCCECFIN